MKRLLKRVLILLSRVIYWTTPKEFRNVPKEKKLTIHSIITENSTKESYEHFKENFKTSVLFRDVDSIRKYAIENAIYNDNSKEDFYLEFGVYQGKSANFFSKYIKKLYAFDSFQGLREDWLGAVMGKGHFNLNKKIPELNSNIEPIVGFAQDTLDSFIENKNPKINFVHLDMDTYPSTKYVLKKLKPLLNKNSIIIFDELYNYSGWENGEYKALKEVFDDDEYIFKAFNVLGQEVVIQII